jgi:hypothetical protein
MNRPRHIELSPSLFGEDHAEIAAVLRELGGMEPTRTAFLIATVMGMRRGEIFGLIVGGRQL